MLAAAAISLTGAVVSVIWAPETPDMALHECSSLVARTGPVAPAADAGKAGDASPAA